MLFAHLLPKDINTEVAGMEGNCIYIYIGPVRKGAAGAAIQ
jgi:hypothetical protein